MFSRCAVQTCLEDSRRRQYDKTTACDFSICEHSSERSPLRCYPIYLSNLPFLVFSFRGAGSFIDRKICKGTDLGKQRFIIKIIALLWVFYIILHVSDKIVITTIAWENTNITRVCTDRPPTSPAHLPIEPITTRHNWRKKPRCIVMFTTRRAAATGL